MLAAHAVVAQAGGGAGGVQFVHALGQLSHGDDHQFEALGGHAGLFQLPGSRTSSSTGAGHRRRSGRTRRPVLRDGLGQSWWWAASEPESRGFGKVQQACVLVSQGVVETVAGVCAPMVTRTTGSCPCNGDQAAAVAQQVSSRDGTSATEPLNRMASKGPSGMLPARRRPHARWRCRIPARSRLSRATAASTGSIPGTPPGRRVVPAASP